MNEPLDREVTVVTPEQVQLQFQTAGIGSRAAAHLLDSVILIFVNVLLFVFVILVSRLYSGSWLPDLADYLLAITIVLWIVLNLGYFVCSEAFMGGQTLGKRWLGLRVIQNNGQSATLLSIIIRNLFRLLDVMPLFYFVGMLSIFLSSKDKRIGDMVAGTLVVVEARFERIKRRKQLEKAIARKNYPEIVMGHIEEAMRQGITAKDWQLLQAWIERVPTMSDARLAELAAPIAHYFAEKLEQDSAIAQDASAFLVKLYETLREDWEV
ncbi:RDD family protein [Paenibacillus sp. CGMCC 1.16610]|uniref:RDD family protein n=1 Tax=Paenibacillus anseongense TaxID=2682845 RepID=A0ABW9UJ92_9BACL|nr:MULTISPECIES: RDD family protein [Paenibacillus]MBA2941999.1 RDD family protein [Paenibacillus sp. CGMCC 1.16610]MVQ38515.1 RDD family protein [Paenibacillus anseongense]